MYLFADNGGGGWSWVRGMSLEADQDDDTVDSFTTQGQERGGGPPSILFSSGSWVHITEHFQVRRYTV